MKHLCDANVWIALAVERHPHHAAARLWLDTVQVPDEVAFNRATQTAFLRLLTQPITADFEPLSQRRAWKCFDAFLGDDRVSWMSEPPDLESSWRRLASRDTPSPKHWMDAYLAALAIEGLLRLVTFDRAYRQFEVAGLDLLLLSTMEPE